MPVVLPDLDVEKVRRFCRTRIPDAVANNVRLEATTRSRSVFIHERRPPWDGSPGEWTSMPIAQPRYEDDGKWTLFFANQYRKWVRYPELEPKQPIDVLISEINQDPTCIFWG
jgi:hypothetical protein